MAQVQSLPRVCVMLSTYNGQQYLREQLDSVLAQKSVDVTLLVRDDGSRDGTRALLQEYASRHPNIQVKEGENLGVVGSFLELMRLASSTTADLFALCDQDDFWLPQKLSEAAKQFTRDVTVPQMYCSVVRYVDKDLRDIGASRSERRPSFGNALVENIATGCTVVMNRALLDLVNSAPPKRALVHDWWIYMVVTAFGHVTFDPKSWILYRQHGGNVIGGSTSFTRMMIVRFRRLWSRKHGIYKCSEQAEEFLRCFGDRCRPEDRQVIEEMLAAHGSLLKRIRFAFSGKVNRGHWLDNGILRVLVIAGMY